MRCCTWRGVRKECHPLVVRGDLDNRGEKKQTCELLICLTFVSLMCFSQVLLGDNATRVPIGESRSKSRKGCIFSRRRAGLENTAYHDAPCSRSNSSSTACNARRFAGFVRCRSKPASSDLTRSSTEPFPVTAISSSLLSL